MNILLAEDDRKLGKLVKYMLEKKGGYHVDWVENGEDALDYARCSAYDVLILDWMMPLLDGVDVCMRLRGDRYGQAIVLLTAKDSLQDKIFGLDAGADDYLTKPFEIDELLARLRGWHGGTSPRGNRIRRRSDLHAHSRLAPAVAGRRRDSAWSEGISAARSVPAECRQRADERGDSRSRLGARQRRLLQERRRDREDAPGQAGRFRGEPAIHSIRGVGYRFEMDA